MESMPIKEKSDLSSGNDMNQTETLTILISKLSKTIDKQTEVFDEKIRSIHEAYARMYSKFEMLENELHLMRRDAEEYNFPRRFQHLATDSHEGHPHAYSANIGPGISGFQTNKRTKLDILGDLNIGC